MTTMCPNCRIRLDPESFCEQENVIQKFDDSGLEVPTLHVVWMFFCPDCGQELVAVCSGLGARTSGGGYSWHHGAAGYSTSIVHPPPQLPAVPGEIPAKYREDYREALAVVDLSPKASAALSRRILEAVLKDEYDRDENSLYHQIDEVLNAEDINIPSSLLESIDVIRNTGNFAAHVQEDTDSGELLDVTAEEAEMTLEILTDLLDHTFVKPARRRDRREEYEDKLDRAGTELNTPDG